MDRPASLPRSRTAIALSGLVLVAYFLLPNARLDFTRFNAHDAESYIALSRSLLEGRGYTRSLDAEVYVPHTTWPPGLPVLLVPGVWIAGIPADLLPIKATIIALGVAGLLLAAEYARRAANSDLAGVLTLILLGANPFYWNFARIAMTEVPAFAWTALSLLLIHPAWSSRPPGVATAFAVGLAAGFGMLLRGTLVGLALAPLAYGLARGPGGARSAAALRAASAFAAGFAVCFAVWSLRNGLIDRAGLERHDPCAAGGEQRELNRKQRPLESGRRERERPEDAHRLQRDGNARSRREASENDGRDQRTGAHTTTGIAPPPAIASALSARPSSGPPVPLVRDCSA